MSKRTKTKPAAPIINPRFKGNFPVVISLGGGSDAGLTDAVVLRIRGSSSVGSTEIIEGSSDARVLEMMPMPSLIVELFLVVGVVLILLVVGWKVETFPTVDSFVVGIGVELTIDLDTVVVYLGWTVDLKSALPS